MKLTGNYLKCSKDYALNLDLYRIGTKIVKKCKGMPLAIKSPGGVLCFALDVREWKKITTSDIWDFPNIDNNILLALRISHYYLPL